MWRTIDSDHEASGDSAGASAVRDVQRLPRTGVQRHGGHLRGAPQSALTDILRAVRCIAAAMVQAAAVVGYGASELLDGSSAGAGEPGCLDGSAWSRLQS